MTHELPPLPFEKDALEPHMSRETLDYHHGKHHQAYVTNLNNLVAGTEYADLALEDIIARASGGIFNNAAQSWNHTFFWSCLSPEGGGVPRGELAPAIDGEFGSFDAFKEQFTKAAISLFGSGWVWLVKDGDGRLSIASTANADNPLKGGQTPLLVCDVWEHAYYIDYRNLRPRFLEAFWNVVNWEFAARTFSAAR